MNRKVKRKNRHNEQDALSVQGAVDIGRGKIKHNHMAAIVTSKLYRSQVEKAKKGKGSYSRKGNAGQEPYLIAA